MNLYESFCTVLASNREIASNGYLTLMAEHIKALEVARGENPLIDEYCGKLSEILARNNFSLNGDHTNDFIQTFGEAHFAYLCGRRGVRVKRVRELKGKKTPDFEVAEKCLEVKFEVKTLSVAGGGRGIDRDIEDNLNANISIERQVKTGKRIAFGESELQPYGEKVHGLRPQTELIYTLLEKARGNIKDGQYEDGKTFLVLNLCLIPPELTDPRTLRPVYWTDLPFITGVSGQLWMLGFCAKGMLVLGPPEFEGKACIEGFNEKEGILIDKAFDKVAGIIFVVYPMRGDAQMFGLFRSSDMEAWNVDGECVWDVLGPLVGDCWNDEFDVNGFECNGQQRSGEA